jgi:transposase-like protein
MGQARVSQAEIIEALRRTGGNIEAASREVGISPWALRKRVARDGAVYSTLEVARLERKREAPPVRLPAEVAELVARGRRRLAVQRDRDLADADVLAEFILAEFPAWLEAQLGEPGE